MKSFLFPLLCALALTVPAAHAQKNIANEELDVRTGTRLQVRSVFDPLPASGYAPMRIVATNGTQQNALWGFSFHPQNCTRTFNAMHKSGRTVLKQTFLSKA